MIKKTLSYLILFIALCSALNAKVSVNGFEIARGVNISHTLSQVHVSKSTDRVTYFTEKDVIFIKYVGFDHIRMPIDEKEMWYEHGEPNEEAWSYLQDVVQWANRHQLRVVLDLHTVRSHHFNAENRNEENTLWTDPAAQEKFIDLWKQISSRMKVWDHKLLAYELLNEAVAPDNEDWNRLVEKTIDAIRNEEPERVLVVGSNHFQSFNTLPFLQVPPDDPNLIVSFHYYNPFPVTHYNTSWNFMREYQGPLIYPGILIPEEELTSGKYSKQFVDSVRGHLKHWDKSVIESEIAEAIRYAKSKGLPLYCGEWGCYVRTPRDIRMQLYRDTIEVFEKYNIAQAIWDYQGDFSVFDPDQKTVIDWEILDSIVGQ